MITLLVAVRLRCGLCSHTSAGIHSGPPVYAGDPNTAAEAHPATRERQEGSPAPDRAEGR